MIPDDLKHPDPRKRRAAISSMAGDQSDEAMATLARLTMDEPEADLRLLCLRTLLGNRPELAGDESVQRMAAKVTGKPAAEAIAFLSRPANAGAGEEGVYEMLWDCEFCGTKKLLGLTHRHCPNCGGKQNPDTRYFPSDDEKIAVKDHVLVGADLLCPACRNPSSAKAKNCGNCGSPLDGAKAAARRADQVQDAATAFAGETLRDARQERKAAAAPASPPKKKGGALKWILLGAGLLVAVIVALLLWKKEAAIVVTGHSWEREVRIERFGPKQASAWCDEMPGRAYNVSRSREVRSQQDVADGEECKMRRVDNGNGTFSQKRECKPKYKKVPVYGDRCKYTIDAWGYERSARSGGASLGDAPRWPAVDLRRGVGDCLGCEREEKRLERYHLQFTTPDGKSDRCEVPQDRWSTTPLKSKWSVRQGMVTRSYDCSTMKPL